jgi:hypothetical protein
MRVTVDPPKGQRYKPGESPQRAPASQVARDVRNDETKVFPLIEIIAPCHAGPHMALRVCLPLGHCHVRGDHGDRTYTDTLLYVRVYEMT